MIACPACGHQFDPRRRSCSEGWCGRAEPHLPGEETCRVRRLEDVVPPDWRGELHLHLGGKAGELLYLSGCFPALREALPGAELVLHLHPHYAGIVPGLLQRPDRVVTDPSYTELPAPVAVQVLRGIKVAVTSHCQGRTLRRSSERTLETCLYIKRRGATFYRLFLENLGLPEGRYELPSWGQFLSSGGPREQVLVLASANQHNGSALRAIPLEPSDWAKLAEAIRARGRKPLATGHADDGRPSMPGWDWIELDRPEFVFDLLRRCAAVVGVNSGMTWAALQLCPGRVTMLDTQGTAAYKFGSMVEDRVVDPARHRQIPLTTEVLERLREVLEEALT